jgi:hypothetical protein
MSLHPCKNRYHMTLPTNPVVLNKHFKRLIYSANQIPHKRDPFIQNVQFPVSQRNQYISRRCPNRWRRHPPPLRLSTKKGSVLIPKSLRANLWFYSIFAAGIAKSPRTMSGCLGAIISASLFILTGPLKSGFWFEFRFLSNSRNWIVLVLWRKKLRCEVATYIWIGVYRPAVPIPRLCGFGVSNGRMSSYTWHLLKKANLCIS